MSIIVNCDECGQTTRVRDEMAGRSIRCRGCGESVPVPGGDDDDTGDDYAIRPSRAPRARAARYRAGDGDGFGLTNKIISAFAAVAVGVTLCVVRLVARAGIRWGLQEDQVAPAPAPQPNQAARPNIKMPPPATPPAFPVQPAFVSPASTPPVHAAPNTTPSFFPPPSIRSNGTRRTPRVASQPPARKGTMTIMYGGAGGSPFQEIAPQGPLLGLRYSLGSWAGEAAIGRLEPVFDRTSATGRVTEVVARAGYAVGGLEVNGATLVNGLRIVFMAIDENGKLDPTERYTSDWIGQPGRGKSRSIDPAGALVIGIHGRRAAVLDAIGLVLE